ILICVQEDIPPFALRYRRVERVNSERHLQFRDRLILNATPYEIIAGVVALITAVVATRKQMKRFEAERRTLSEREREKKRIRYLDPLRVAARDLPDKITGLSKELHCKESFRKGAFREIKDKDRNNKGDFAFWCNGYGVGAVTALYVTAIYFAHARKIRSDIPFIQLGPREDQNLLKYLYKVREAFGAENDPWVEIQDSPGGYVTDPDGTIQ
ncbi:MAG: hypothetical protein ABFD97_22910, partial [Syntrophobacter sp.]